MPSKPARIAPCCGARVPPGARCACQIERDRQRKAKHDATRPGARARGYDRAWEQAAAAFLREPGNERCACGAPATVVMHRVSIRKRPDLRMVRSNWRPGCVRCNAIDAAKDKAGGGRQLSADASGPARGPEREFFPNRPAKIEVAI